jgi:hypothetical protein
MGSSKSRIIGVGRAGCNPSGGGETAASKTAAGETAAPADLEGAAATVAVEQTAELAAVQGVAATAAVEQTAATAAVEQTAGTAAVQGKEPTEVTVARTCPLKREGLASGARQEALQKALCDQGRHSWSSDGGDLRCRRQSAHTECLGNPRHSYKNITLPLSYDC